MDFKKIKAVYDLHHKKVDSVYIELDKKDNESIMEYAHKAAALRHGEKNFTGTSLEKLSDAFAIGGSGEVAVCKLFGGSYRDADFEVKGEAYDFATYDLKKIELDLGVKTSTEGLPHMVYTDEIFEQKVKEGKQGAEILCTVKRADIKRDKSGRIAFIKGVYIDGLAQVNALRAYQSRELIFKQDCEKYKNRSGFYGYEKLISLKDEATRKLIIRLYRIYKSKAA